MNYVGEAGRLLLEGSLFMVGFIILLVGVDIFRAAREGRKNLRERLDKNKNSK